MEEQITIGETVKKDFRAAQVFTRHGIDFCCGGKKTISDACREKKVNENELRAELAKITSGSDTVAELINSMDADALANYIVKKHHSYVTDTIPVIMQYLDKVLFNRLMLMLDRTKIILIQVEYTPQRVMLLLQLLIRRIG